MSGRNRLRRPARRTDTIEARQRILVVSEGKRTEPEYLQGFRRWCRAQLVEIVLFGGEGVPITLVTSARERRIEAANAAKRERDENLGYDQVWCVFDRDDHPRFEEAIKMAEDHGLHLAVSNPCVELWLLLHFRDNPGMQHREQLEVMLKQYVHDYDKAVDFTLYAENYHHAHRRAAKLDEHCRNDEERFRNPSTGMYLLTEAISRYSSLDVPQEQRSTTSTSNVSADSPQARSKPRTRKQR
jgi:hypothetical protein